MIRRLCLLLLVASGCGDGDNTEGAVAGERCKNDASTECGANIYEVLLCVNGTWEVQETCDRDSELCEVSGGEAVCTVGS